jgi:hypothetical protein
MKTRFLGPVVALALIVAASGCGGGLAQVTGRITYKGKPVPSTQVTFQPADGSRPSKGLTDDDGKFMLKYSRTEPGATRGPHKVFLSYVVSNEEELHKIEPKASDDLKAVIASYSDPEKTTLKYDITRNGQYIEINLE